MKLWSDSWANGEPIPDRYAAGRLAPPDGVTFADNVSPHLAWSDLPAGTRALALICHDFDVPSKGDDVNQAGREVPADLPRVDFFHWVLTDLPGSATSLPEGAFSRGFTAHGKPGPQVAAAGFAGARHGINDFTGWFAGDPAMAGDYYGYDGPFPPWNDSLLHHYVFTLYALAVPRVPVEGRFGGAELRQAIYPHVLGAATHSGTYTLNRRLLR
ncbi:MAG: YbhB/YbcL family Raf kinase inhibitor-like protein [Burkholderiales bacterium]|nr:YbhB/YbcL family Raf kinase inhibitor-like protein [Burkholderiales bacterium]